MEPKLKVSIIGVGKQGNEYLSCMPHCKNATLASLVDLNYDQINKIKYSDSLHKFANYTDLLDNKPDVAIVCAPHNQHFKIVQFLLEAGVSVIKEKPYALSCNEAYQYEKLQDKTGKKIYIPMKRRYNPLFQAFHGFKNKIGDIFYFEATYTKNIADLEDGWRSSFRESGGGALIDMGYHFIDLLIWYLGEPCGIHSEFGFGNRSLQIYDVEDTANLQIIYKREKKIMGNVVVSRVFTTEREHLAFWGTEGNMHISNLKSCLFDKKGEVIESVEKQNNKNINITMLQDLFTKIISDEPGESHFGHVNFIERAYKATEDNENYMINQIKNRKIICLRD